MLGRWAVQRALGLAAERWARRRVAGARGAGPCSGRAGERQARGARRRAAGAWARAREGERQLGAGAGGRQGAGRAGHARPGRLGWPWAVHSVHSAHFRSVLTRFFFLSYQMNTVHCKIKIFQKKQYIY